MIESYSDQSLPKRMSRLIVIGFAILIGLMALLTANSVLHMENQNELVTKIVEQHNRKIQLATDLLQATHSRHNSLVYQALVADPFEQDEHFQQYIKAGYEVGKARNELRAMRLDAFEAKILAEQDVLVKEIVTLHETISDLARRGMADEARSAISSDLRPYNIQFIDSVSKLVHYERDKIQVALIEAQRASHRAIITNIGLGTALILIACLIGSITYRQFNRHGRTIQDQMVALENTGVQLKHEATHDPMTGLPNRSLFYHRLREAMTHARQEGLRTTVIYVDMDNFKPVNDQHGHAVGDSLLQAVAGRLLNSVRTTDTVARLGGDEFAIILLGVGEPERIAQTVENIQSNVSQPIAFGDIVLNPSCSCGHAVFPIQGSNMDTLLHAADAHMYEAKRSRKTGLST